MVSFASYYFGNHYAENQTPVKYILCFVCTQCVYMIHTVLDYAITRSSMKIMISLWSSYTHYMSYTATYTCVQNRTIQYTNTTHTLGFFIFTVTCPTIPTPSNGRLSTSDNTRGTTVTITCNDGYELDSTTGSSSSVCGNNGEWNPSLGRCKRGQYIVYYIIQLYFRPRKLNYFFIIPARIFAFACQF